MNPVSPACHPPGELLRVDMRVLNTGNSAFDFTAALHTYIEVRRRRAMACSL